MPIWFDKDPDATLTYTVIWDDVLPEGDPIISSDWIVSGLSLVSDYFTDTTTSVMFSGGVVNTIYQVINRIHSSGGIIDDKILEIQVKETKVIDSLIKELRLHLGDLDPTSYRYLDMWLTTALLTAVKTLQRWWNYKYLVDYLTNDVYRNPNVVFTFAPPPEIEDQDVRPIILMASIIIKSGQLENMSWSLSSWRDAEISFSNISSGSQKENSIKRDKEELLSLLTPPTNKLTGSKKVHLPGYFEIEF